MDGGAACGGAKEIVDRAKACELAHAVSVPDPRRQAGREPGRRDRAILEFLYATGIRVGELVNIDVSDIDLRERLVRVLGKRKKERIVPFHEHSLQALLLYLSQS